MKIEKKTRGSDGVYEQIVYQLFSDPKSTALPDSSHSFGISSVFHGLKLAYDKFISESAELLLTIRKRLLNKLGMNYVNHASFMVSRALLERFA